MESVALSVAGVDIACRIYGVAYHQHFDYGVFGRLRHVVCYCGRKI